MKKKKEKHTEKKEVKLDGVKQVRQTIQVTKKNAWMVRIKLLEAINKNLMILVEIASQYKKEK